MLEYEIKDKKYYNNLKKIFNKEYNLIYKEHYAPKPNIGDCSYLYYKYKPTSYEDFFEKYTKDYNNDFSYITHTGDIHCGRSFEQFLYLSKCYLNDIQEHDKKNGDNTNVTLQMCFDDLFNHVIVETFDGKIVENHLFNLIKESSDDFLAEICFGRKDANYGADIIVKKKSDRKYVRYLQVKPNTFFKESKNESLIQDRINAIKKEKKLKEVDSNAIIEYVIYDRDALFSKGIVLIAKKDGKTKFKINDLILDDGSLKFDIIKDFTYEIPGKQKENARDN